MKKGLNLLVILGLTSVLDGSWIIPAVKKVK